MAKIIVTAGGTIEKMDDVRSIRNEATGTLGATIADKLVKQGHHVTYIHGMNAKMPKTSSHNIEIIGVKDLDETVTTLLTQDHYDYFIHSMAVSDFFVGGHYSYEEIKHSKTEASLSKKTSGKISSDNSIFIQLKQAPKVIKKVKKLQPDIKLIGFKLLAGSEDSDLIKAAHAQIEKSGSNLVIANHKEQVSNQVHRALFIDKEGVCDMAETKDDIADKIVAYIKKEGCLNE